MKVPFLDLKTQFAEIKDELLAEMADILDTCSFIGGNRVHDFEQEMAAYLGARHVITCANGTDALMLGLKSCGIKPGDEVITTPFTFFATAEAIAAIGAVPVFVDIRPDDYNMDPEKISEAISDKTKAILPVHIFGAVCDMDAITSTAWEHGLKVIEDDAQAIGSEYKGRKAGTLGDIGCFSFYPTKNLGGAGDGGMLTTDDDGLEVIVRAYREHGAGPGGAKAFGLLGGHTVPPDTKAAVTELYNPYKYYNYLIGYNSRLDAMQAAILSIKLHRLDGYNRRRARIAEMYAEGLTSKIMLPRYSTDVKTCWHQFVIRSHHKQELCDYLTEHEIGNGTFYPIPLHRQKAFDRRNCGNPNAALPVAEEISSQTVCLPIFPEMTDEMVAYVIDTVNAFHNGKLH